MNTWSTQHSFTLLALSTTDSLPDLAMINLSDWGMVTLVGPDSKSYLQGQLTCDVVSLAADTSTVAGHCDAKGKLRTIMRLFHYQDGYGLVQRQSVMANQLPELKKYAVFSKTEITQTSAVILALVGTQAQAMIDHHFSGDADVRHNDTTTVVKVDSERWLIITTAEQADTVIATLGSKAILATTELWNLYDIKAAIPRIDNTTELEFIPQAVNLQAVGGISFKKGCYTGQETVARAKYRGINKRAMYIITGATTQCPQAGDALERSVGENWRKGGTVICGYQYSDNQALALVVLPNDLDADSQFRFAANPDALWHKLDLPYDLNAE